MKKEFVFDEQAYAEFIKQNSIVQNSKGERVICNGDMLHEAMQDGYLLDEWLESIGMNPYDLDI